MTDRIAVVTGGSQGLGFAIAAELVAAGYHVAILGRRADALEAAAQRLGNATAIVADVSDKDSIRNAFAEVDALPGRLSVLVNNAGVFVAFPVEAAEPDFVDEMIRTNLTGPILCTSEAVRRMKVHGSGDIVNITSDAADRGFPLLSVYGATKAGLEQFADGLNTELRNQDIRFLSARVGRMKTEGAAAGMAGQHAQQFYAAVVEAGMVFFSGKGMDPASVAKPIVAAIATPRDARPQFIEIRSA